MGRKFGKFGKSRVIRQTKTIQTFPLQISSHHSPCIELYEFRFKALFIAAVVLLYSYLAGSSQHLLMPLTTVPIDQRISWQNPGYKFLNMLYNNTKFITHSIRHH